MWGNHFHATLGRFSIQRISVVGAVADQPLGQVVYESCVERGSDGTTLARRSRGGTDGES
jgi:hypothetical protein